MDPLRVAYLPVNQRWAAIWDTQIIRLADGPLFYASKDELLDVARAKCGLVLGADGVSLVSAGAET